MFFLSLFSFAFLYKEGLLDLVRFTMLKVWHEIVDNFNCYSKSKKAKQQISINEKTESIRILLMLFLVL